MASLGEKTMIGHVCNVSVRVLKNVQQVASPLIV